MAPPGAVPANANEFVDLVRKSGVSDVMALEAHVQKIRADGRLPADPGRLAGLLVHDGYLTCFQAEQLLQGKWRRYLIGKYKVLEQLGSGDTGMVFLCQHMPTQRLVAIKLLPTAMAADAAALDRFYNEARVVAALDHPNVVHAYDIDQDENLHFLVMEYIDGSSLQGIVGKSGPMSVARAANYMGQVAIGLEYIHQAGFVHCNIDPANILVDRRGLVKVIDMGHALLRSEMDRRADIYCLGAMFYFLLTGKQRLGIQQPRPDVPPNLRAVIEKMLAQDPAQRHSSSQAVAHDLTPWVQNDNQPLAAIERPAYCPLVSALLRQHAAYDEP